MKLFVVLFAIVATTVATKVTTEYLPPLEQSLPAPINEYLPPVESEPAHTLADDGYRYKTVRRLRYRHRRDVNELPSNEYLPPVQQSVVAPAPSQEYLPPVSAVAQPDTVLADDGYRYKTVRRLRYRHRRDVNELPSNEYLPPVQQSVVAPAPSQEYLPPVSAVAQPDTVLADDGYRYKTVRRLRYRHRRDVNELPSNEYLPPVQQSVPAPAPSQEYLPPVSAAVQPDTVLADDGYRYKTVRRLRYRHRRDVNELPSNEYLPPVQQSVPAPAPSQEYLPPVSAVAQPDTVLSDDGYRYKTVRRLRYRHRRDVNELPSNEYLPPVQQSVPAPAPSQEYLPPVSAAVQPDTVLADDGYRYKTVRRLRYRHRRDVNELPSNEYLPPVQQSVPAPAPSQEYLPPVSAVAQPDTVLADDGYRYKTIRRLRYRHRRDVNELPSNEYLPPVQQSVPAPAPSQEYLPPVSAVAHPDTVLSDDGYRYKTVRRLRYRHRRDVNELPSNEYLPPVQQSVPAPAPSQEYLPPVSAAVQPDTVLADDGYRYKTVRRLRYRHRRDVNELPSNEYLPPVQQSVPAPAPSQEYLPPVSAVAQPDTVLSDDGYRYKTVRRLRYRHRRDVNELPSNEYLPPVQQSVPAPAPSQEYLPPVSAAVQPDTVLADDGYRYKTVRRLRYRHRRDVNELPSNEYLPPVQQSVPAPAPSQEYLPPVSAVAQPDTVLADDGYRYKTIRRLRYRHRRDVNELPSNEYLPPVQQSVPAPAPSQEYLPPVSAVAHPDTVLSDDGYRYKTVRRLRYRHRRDVNELPSNEYLPPIQQSDVAPAPSQEYLPPVSAAVQPDTVLADDGYRYKVVRKLKYRRH